MSLIQENNQKPKENRKLQQKRNKCKSLEESFKYLNKTYVKMKSKEKKCNNNILYAVLQKFLTIMKNHNPLFCIMKPKLGYLGSYYDGLRVGQPTEYDINVILYLPVNYDKIYLDATGTTHDCTNIFMPSEFRRLSKNPTTVKEGFQKTSIWCDCKYRFSVKKFRSWMQGVVDTAIEKLRLEKNKRLINVDNKRYIIAAKMSGPACTITITPEGRDNDNNKVIDVDLVPTFSFELPKKPYGSNVLFHYLESINVKREYFVVPKPSQDEFSWRLSFPFQERYYIGNKNNLKSTAKLLKLLRDAQDFKQLASYYIKTIFLWEVQRQNDDFWKRKSLSYLVLHMLNVLRYCLAQENIKNFWCPEMNLIKGKLKSETCQNWSNRLAVIINDIKQNGKNNPNIIIKYFTKKN
ncbi:cyclic GMP-AMP synthase-like receptor isoform X1 [Pectinophora gossypiella]|uniref:cyclic GMP-AMP synthase-like receptor isoform X1 n=1 Tax=Pectinophora gossypiella TaxID=13191 RepID=UPI00214F51D3|nr:cyclic GMP-AMP synthase-like receptor isoform X1 [Pectinophora gossypiella]